MQSLFICYFTLPHFQHGMALKLLLLLTFYHFYKRVFSTTFRLSFQYFIKISLCSFYLYRWSVSHNTCLFFTLYLGFLKWVNIFPNTHKSEKLSKKKNDQKQRAGQKYQMNLESRGPVQKYSHLNSQGNVTFSIRVDLFIDFVLGNQFLVNSWLQPSAFYQDSDYLVLSPVDKTSSATFTCAFLIPDSLNYLVSELF